MSQSNLSTEQTQKKTMPSSQTKRELLAKIDTLPTAPSFKQISVPITGDLLDNNNVLMVEDAELWCRDPVECIRELVSHSALSRNTVYSPVRSFLTTKNGETKRLYDE